MAQSNPDKIEMMDERGFPREIKAKINEIIAEVNRDFVVNFDTDSLNPIAKVRDTPSDGTKPARRTVTLPRAAAVINGTSANPYIMGTNRTDPDLSHPADDTWDITNPPMVSGVKTDGVIISAPGGGPGGLQPGAGYIRFYEGTTNEYDVLQSPGPGAYRIFITQFYMFQRFPTLDSKGIVIAISAENLVPSGSGQISHMTIS